jgi:DNA-binding transcriptional ArsR family regulator
VVEVASVVEGTSVSVYENVHGYNIVHSSVNDCTYVSVWQDVRVDDARNQRAGEVNALAGGRPGSSPGLAGSGMTSQQVTGTVEFTGILRTREISDVETLRLVADQTRLAILRILMSGAEFTPPVMSAKELAAALGEPQTKLYRHLKQLEEAGLIQVAETRLVSGIVEQRYRAGQVAIGMNPAMLVDPTTRSVATETIVAAINDFRDELIGDLHTGRGQLDRDSILWDATTRIPSDKVDELRGRLEAVLTEFSQASASDGVKVHAFVAWYQDGTTDNRE